MGIDWDKPLRVKSSKQSISDHAKWKSGDAAFKIADYGPGFQLCRVEGEWIEDKMVSFSDIENVPETYWIATSNDHTCRRVDELSQLTPGAWPNDTTCIELEPVTNGPDRVVQTILLGDAE